VTQYATRGLQAREVSAFSERLLQRMSLHLPNRPGELRPEPLTGRVEDWRAGLGRCLCSLLPRPFVCECHNISTMPRFQSPPRRRSERISCTTLTCLLHLKVYVTYPAGATFGCGR
jgi:hypothetical protein